VLFFEPLQDFLLESIQGAFSKMVAALSLSKEFLILKATEIEIQERILIKRSESMSPEKFVGRSIALSFPDGLSDVVSQHFMERDDEICL